MKKKYYLEAVRITAVLLVMYNHSAPFMSFATQHGVQYAVSFFLSLVCKAAVPLFYMVSGALLLGKNESFGELARKRILRIVAVIVIFSLLYYLKFAVRGQASVTPIRFLLGLPFDVAFLPYWYLYSYLGILVSLPFLRPLAQNMPKNAFWYLIALQIVTESLQITLGFFGYHTLCGYFSVAGVLQTTLFYPVIEDEWRHLPGDVSRCVDASYHACDFYRFEAFVPERGSPGGTEALPVNRWQLCVRSVPS